MTDETKETKTTEEPVAEEQPTTGDVVTDASPAEEAVASDATAPRAQKAPRAKARNAHVRTEVRDAPAKYAVIETGGKQYRVKVGDQLTIEKLIDDAGSDITFDRVLLLGGDGSTRVGTPVVEGASVAATVNDHGRGEKIVVFKFKAKKRYRRRTGHRQPQTYITITGING